VAVIPIDPRFAFDYFDIKTSKPNKHEQSKVNSMDNFFHRDMVVTTGRRYQIATSNKTIKISLNSPWE
jgi:hypothetical protein